ncbi:hypothetical protein [Paraburkholderia youngii]|uniref:hypothetical protein n=1 Tax=Paraburkholderia youngii TaxID=2782701 RepID=UPI003D1DD5D3
MTAAATPDTALTRVSLTPRETPTCEVRYVFEDGQTYAKLTKDDLDALLRERRLTYKVLRVTLAVAFVGSVMAAGYAASVGYGPPTHALLVPVGCAK